tara:strand:+ start:336 stop:545 length:210 start_codon:yes stop_codon:yes gene_type:complete
MIDYLTFIDELKEIKTSLKSNTTNQLLFTKLEEKISKYENMVNEFETENAPIDHVARARENARIEGFIR